MTLAPISWFRDPGFTEPTPLTFTPDGRVSGHVALWGTSHRSFPNRQITPPRSRTDYAMYHVGSTLVEGDDGQPVTISTGTLAEGGHADIHLSADATQAFYDDPAKIVATCCVGDDSVGIWMAGALLPDVARDQLRVARLRAASASGDWRGHDGGGLELCAIALVNCPGFPIPRARVASGAPLALVAAGALAPARPLPARRVDPTWPGLDEPTDTPADGDTASGSPFGAIVTSASGARVELAADGTVRVFNTRGHQVDLDAAPATPATDVAGLLADLDDRPALIASLLAEVDDRPAQLAGLLDQLADDDGDFDISRMPPQLRESYLHGKAAAKIAWGTPGDFTRCVAEATHHGIPARERKGMCAQLHRDANGYWPGDKRNR